MWGTKQGFDELHEQNRFQVLRARTQSVLSYMFSVVAHVRRLRYSRYYQGRMYSLCYRSVRITCTSYGAQ
jgi:hypothetical protein